MREDLNARCQRRMAVLRPLKLVITNYPEHQEQSFVAQNHPEFPEQGTRVLPFGRELYIENEDFMDDPPKKWFRLALGQEVRLRYACLVTCQEVIRDANGEPIELRCKWDPNSPGGTPSDGRKVRGTLHWVSARHAVNATVRLYDRLFKEGETEAEDDTDDKPLAAGLNPESLETLTECKLEPALAGAGDAPYQFERLGYFFLDSDSRPEAPVFNRTLGLRDTWAKLSNRS
jgi:glutaminyl-tRNA synthetase